MKKAMTFFMALTLALGLAACGKGTVNSGVPISGDILEDQFQETHSEEFEPVPLGDFSARDFEGNTITKDLFGEYDLTMVNLWTTTCSYCIQEMPVLNELRKEFQEDGVSFNIVSICMDVGNTEEIHEENLEKAKEIMEKAEVEFPNLIPDSVLLEGLLKGIQAYQESFFVDREGNVVSEPYIGSMPKNHWRVTMNNEIEKLAQDGDKE